MASAQLLEVVEGKLGRLPDNSLREIPTSLIHGGIFPIVRHHEI